MKTLLLLLGLLAGSVCLAQTPLDDYVRLGLENNLSLKQKETSYRNSLEALREARGLFFPNISLNARYSVAEGGRTIDLPIGDLLNPVYSTLNQMLHDNRFPQIDNQSFMFLRPQEQETKIRLIQPLFNPDIYFNARIHEEMAVAERVSVDQFRQELIAEIRKAWYRACMADRVVRMLSDTRSLLEENVRVNDRLVQNGKLTLDHLYRAQTELSKFGQQQQEAQKNKEIASAYLNFLINRPLQDPVILDEPAPLPLLPDDSEGTPDQALARREEMKMLGIYENIAELQLRMNRAGALPSLMVVADYGIQGETYRFKQDADFGQASAILSWDLFAGFQNRSKIRQALIRQESLSRQKEEVQQQISLQVLKAREELKTSHSAIESAESQVRSAREGFRLVNRRYGEGQASLIEFLDARATLTQAEENVILSRYRYLIDFAEFDKVCALKEY